MTTPTNEALASAICEYQEQIKRLSGAVENLSAADIAHSSEILKMQHQIVGFGVAFQIFAELVMAASADIKQQVAAATTQVLARPGCVDNETLSDLLQALNKAAISASRTSPEGRRANFQIVTPDEGQDSET